MERDALKNKEYDLVSVVYNASQAAETCRQYIQDAREDGDQECERFFNTVVERNTELVQQAKELLKDRIH